MEEEMCGSKATPVALARVVSDAGPIVVGGVSDGVVFGFTERTGGVSQVPYASLNLGAHVGDDPAAVGENRRRVLAAIGASGALERLVVPNQVHGDRIVTITSANPEHLAAARSEAAAGADAIVVTAPDVPVMLCFADCVPVVLVCPGGFAIVHSGWKGTYAGIAGAAARALMAAAGAPSSSITAYIGPHIQGDEYEVSLELMDLFAARFDAERPRESRLLDLTSAIVQSLAAAGVAPGQVLDTELSTVRNNDRFFSYRAESGQCGRHAAVAVMGSAAALR